VVGWSHNRALNYNLCILRALGDKIGFIVGEIVCLMNYVKRFLTCSHGLTMITSSIQRCEWEWRLMSGWMRSTASGSRSAKPRTMICPASGAGGTGVNLLGCDDDIEGTVFNKQLWPPALKASSLFLGLADESEIDN
jgi:hypothetical protein